MANFIDQGSETLPGQGPMCSSKNPSAWTFDGATTLAAGENFQGGFKMAMVRMAIKWGKNAVFFQTKRVNS